MPGSSPTLRPTLCTEKRRARGGEQPLLYLALDAGGVGVGHPEAGEDNERPLEEREVRQPTYETLLAPGSLQALPPFGARASP